MAGTRRTGKELKRDVFYIDPDLSRRLRIAAATEGISISELVEQAIREMLDKAAQSARSERSA